MDDHQRQELEAISNLNRNIDISGNDLDNVVMQSLGLGGRSSRVPSATETMCWMRRTFDPALKWLQCCWDEE